MIVFALFLIVPSSVMGFESEVTQDFHQVESMYKTLFKNFEIKLRKEIVKYLKNNNMEIETEMRESKLGDDFIKLESAFEKIFLDFKHELKKDLENQMNMKEIKMELE